MHIRAARVADAVAIARVNRQVWEETYRGLMPDETLDGFDEAALATRIRAGLTTVRPVATLVAERDGVPAGPAIVGTLVYGPMRGDSMPHASEVYAVNVIRAVHGTGCAQALFKAMADDLVARRPGGIGLWTVRGNARASRFYEKLGGVALPGTRRGWHGAIEVGFGWGDVTDLAARLKT